jgi:hypothetical protein
VTADSVYNNPADPGYSNCLSGLIDGKFYAEGINASTKCCAQNAPTGYNGYLSIDMGV